MFGAERPAWPGLAFLDGPKGPVTEVARTAGILAAKRTSEWIPMCHVLALDHVTIQFEQVDADLRPHPQPRP